MNREPELLTRRFKESQVGFVKRMLRTNGHLSAHEATYYVRWPDGSRERAQITRLAAIIFNLRHHEGWVIESLGEVGDQQDYRLVSQNSGGEPVEKPESITLTPEPVVSEPVEMREVPPGEPRLWACFSCGHQVKDADVEVNPFDERFASATCPMERKPRTFRVVKR